jgi:hypothetical protein
MTMRIFRALLPAMCALLLAQPHATLRAQSPPSGSAAAAAALAPTSFAVAPERSGPIELDGIVDEAAWRTAQVLPATQHWPDFGADRTGRTRFRVLHDEDHLWISGVFHAAPRDVRGISLYRDRWNGDDGADILIDGSDDGATGLLFMTTPLGVRLDSEIRNDATDSGGIEAQNDEWNGFWQASSAIIDEGWSFEMRIPYETLGMRRGEGPPTVGVILSRYLAATDERDIFPAIPPEWSRAHAKPSRAHRLELPAARPGLPLFATPYLLTGAERTRDRTSDDPAPVETKVPFEVGGDVRVGVGSGLTLDLTVNTDFAQAESDALQVNLDRFNLFFPEKRQFFQERANNFEFQMGPEIRLFHSRAIGLDDTGQPRRILGGGRLTGSLGAWQVGALSLQVDGAEPGAGENNTVLRLVRGIGGGRSYLGGIATSRLVANGRSEFTFGGDALVQLDADEFLTVQAASTSGGGVGTRGAGTARAGTARAGLVERSAVRVAWERRRVDGFAWAVEGVRAGTNFRPALGFQARDAFTSTAADLYFSRRPEAGGPVSRWRLISTTRSYWRTGDGSLESALQRLRAQFTFRSGLFWNTALNFTFESLQDALTLPGASVPAGRYHGVDVFTFVDLPRSLRFGGSAIVYVGSVFDGRRLDVTLAPRLNFSRHLTLQPELRLQRLYFAERDQTVYADGAGLRIQAALDTRFSTESFLQYSRAADRVAANVRLRYHHGEGSDVFLVYEGVRDLDAALDAEQRALGQSDGRLLLKVTHTLRW